MKVVEYMANNIICADCGYNPDLRKKIKEVPVNDIIDENGFDLTGITNIHLNLAAEDADIKIKDFNNMESGKVYMLIASNGATTKNQVTFLTAPTLYNGDIVAENNMTIVYKFWTDGYSIYCDRAIYK